MIDALQASFRDVAKACQDHNLVMPLIVCIASPNGSFLAIRIGAKESTVLAERLEGDGFRGSFRIMLVDQTNKAVKFAMSGDDRRASSWDDWALQPM